MNDMISSVDPIKIVIKGCYYDSQIYRGRLYLWTLEGVLEVYNWNKLINTFVIPKFKERVPIVFGFMEGNFLYDKKVSYFLTDDSFNSLLLKQYKELETKPIEITAEALNATRLYKEDVPLQELPVDTEIYANNVYFALEKGLYRKVLHSSEADPALGPKDTKLWDNRILSLRANKYPQIALSAGSDGLFELNLVKDKALKPQALECVDDTLIYKISERPSSFSNYSFLSVFSSSYVENSFMALFNWRPLDRNLTTSKNKVYRDFESLIEGKHIFGERFKEELCWGIDDKIYRITDKKLLIFKFNNSANLDKGEQYYAPLKSVELPADIGTPISVGTTYFGIVLEFTNGILVLRSDGNITVIPEEVIRWRVYPRSKNYLNHLHLLFNDRMEVYSFNHDALVNQQTKRIGMEYVPDEQPVYMKSSTSLNNEIYTAELKTGDFDSFNVGNVDLPF